MWSLPISTWRTMFSRTTIASSIRMPIASDSASSDIDVEREAERAAAAMNVASTETGSARPVMTVERHEFRNRKTTSTVSSAPSTSVSSTLLHRVAHALAGVAHHLDASCPAAAVGCDLGDPRLHAVGDRGRAVPACDFTMSRPIAWRPLKSAATAARRRRRRHVGDLAERDELRRCASRRRAARSPRDARGVPRGGSSARSSAPFTLPTGAARFCARSAVHDLVDADAARREIASGRTSTLSCALSPPTTFTCATPRIARSSPRDRLVGELRQLRRRQRRRRQRQRDDRQRRWDRSAG